MSVVWILFICSVVLFPGVALLALHWAIQRGEFSHLDKTALSIFDDEEPVGLLTDRFPDPARTNAKCRMPKAEVGKWGRDGETRQQRQP